MPIIATGVLITMGIQTIVTLVNQRLNSKNAAEIKKMQQQEKQEIQQHSIERDYKRFQRSCKLQLQMEKDAHKERLKVINQELLNTFDKMAHQVNLNWHYPLNISPYVIAHSVIPTNGTQLENTRQEIFCLLTNSNDSIFNKEVIPYVDMALGNLISSYWNQDSMHTMCYFTNTWNENKAFCDEDIDNLKSTIVTPTLTLTPYFEKNDNGYAIVIKVNIWGIGTELCCQIKTDITFGEIPTKYSTAEIDKIVSNLVPSILCIAALNVDAYYWSSYHQPPILPKLIHNGVINLEKGEKDTYINAYIQLYETVVLGQTNSLAKNDSYTTNIKDIAMINLCNFPEPNIDFLRDVVSITNDSKKCEQLIEETFVNLYESHTGLNFVTFTNVDVNMLQKEDFVIISSLLNLTQNNSNNNLYKNLLFLTRKKIESWN